MIGLAATFGQKISPSALYTLNLYGAFIITLVEDMHIYRRLRCLKMIALGKTNGVVLSANDLTHAEQLAEAVWANLGRKGAPTIFVVGNAVFMPEVKRLQVHTFSPIAKAWVPAQDPRKVFRFVFGEPGKQHFERMGKPCERI